MKLGEVVNGNRRIIAHSRYSFPDEGTVGYWIVLAEDTTGTAVHKYVIWTAINEEPLTHSVGFQKPKATVRYCQGDYMEDYVAARARFRFRMKQNDVKLGEEEPCD